jgi:proteic killer suppression protein
MIVSYRDKETERLSAGVHVKRFEAVARAARMKLNKLKAATALTDVTGLHGNHFEKLKGDREGQFSIRVNDQWRLCFTWDLSANGFADVELVDYH